jgi:mannose-6-phosphate isomerase-like protein (cupin superfamily)
MIAATAGAKEETMSESAKQTTAHWMVRHVDDLPAQNLEGVKITRVLEGTAFDNLGCEYVVLEKGQSLETHVHEEANSFILVLAGAGVVEMEGRDIAVSPGHTIYVPAGVSHGFRTGDEPLVLYGFQSPPIIQDVDHVDILFKQKEGQSVISPWAEADGSQPPAGG